MAIAAQDRKFAPPTDRLVKGEELLEHPEWGPCELIRGKVMPVCRPNSIHGMLVTELASRLWEFVRPRRSGKVFSGDAGIYLARDPDTVRGPDVYYVRMERLPLGRIPEKYMEIPPDLCVEIISPNDTWTDINEKVEMYFAAKVGLVWVIDPVLRKAYVYHNAFEAQTVETLSGEDIIPGFALKTADLFAALD